MINKIETKNLLLRKARYDDLESIWNNVWKDETLASTMLWRVTDNINDAKGRLERTIKYQSKNYSYFICLKEKDEPIGFIGFIKKYAGPVKRLTEHSHCSFAVLNPEADTTVSIL